MKNDLLKAEKIFKHFGPLQALHEMSFSIEKGTIFGILGESGAGKSTLLRILSTLEKPSGGKIDFLGLDLSKTKGKELRALRHKIGMIFQNFHLLSSRTVAENIAYPLEIYNEFDSKRVEDVLRLVGLEDKRDVYPAYLSGGQKQRVGIARALVTKPEILFCDEATSALDPKTTHEILQLLKDLNQQLGLTIVMITHQMEVVREICHKAMVLEKGRVVEEGAVKEIKFLQQLVRQIPPQLRGKTLYRLNFFGDIATQSIITQLVREWKMDVNILLGEMNMIQGETVGNLVVEINSKTHEDLLKALSFLEKSGVQYEVIS